MSLPKMGDRLTEALRQRIEKDKQKSKSSTQAPFDGEGKLINYNRLTAGGTNTYKHGLGREPRGWMLMSPRTTGVANGMITEVSRNSTDLVLKNDCTTAAIVFDLWIY